MKGLRILHFLSPQRWHADTFNARADSNFKVVLKTIDFLPECHHYVLMPLKHNADLYRENVTLLKYDYPHSVMLNRTNFDHRQIRLDFRRTDVDFVFNHQPEATQALQQFFHTKRYFTDMIIFNFFHWVDCRLNNGGFNAGQPTNTLRQLEAMCLAQANFVHNKQLSLGYFESNYETEILNHVQAAPFYEMPLSSNPEEVSTPFDLPDKKIILFNHRYSNSSGISYLTEILEHLPEEFVVWFTDEDCDIKHDQVIVKHLSYSDYLYLCENCHCSLCLIDAYSTWNLSAQDSLSSGRPLLYLRHATLDIVVGEGNRGGAFSDVEEFYHLLNNLPEVMPLPEHDKLFRENLELAMLNSWKQSTRRPKHADAWRSLIEQGITEKREITDIASPNVDYSGSFHYIRRLLLQEGVSDDYRQASTRYFIEGNSKTLKFDLFNQPT